ncbi:acetolactate synthase catalytic subunit [Ornatilinea apprima]|uniref:Acetolactate synthase n=1 Tax=Ornatilinea apprima TaxID=1134406 RepID=A0A0P6WVZ8_9CHLR|nr:biosynthetic-type acetolactate synthase large subunit [Ornatilinea apprima]KPL70142.1 acetolactate synthase catalytic subunit [Ornatilinea apprima]
MKYSGAQIIWESLLKEGVDVIFGFPGGNTIPIHDALLDYPGIRHILVRHEQGAAHAADGYARVSGKVGVCLATSGPGATNLVTGIATAMLDSTPMVAITGQVFSHLIGSDAFQEVDVTGITLPITKHNYLVTDVNEISRTIHEAFYIARSGRPGPVLIDITKDAQVAQIEWDPAYEESIRLPGYRPDLRPSMNDFEQAAKMIAAAERPVILAGQGILKSGAMSWVRELAEKTDTPVATTLLGIGAFPASHPLNLGMMGMHGEAWVNHTIQNADLLLALGMRFDDRVTGSLSTYAPNSKKIHFELDPSEVNKNVRVDLALIGDLSELLQKLVPNLPQKTHTSWNEEINKLRSESALRDILYTPDNGRLYAAHIMHDILRATQGKAVIVTDVGQHQMWAAQYYKHDYPYHMVTSGGLGTMGFGLPAAIGAKMADQEAEVWVIAGDGGFQMTQAELSTTVQAGIKVNVAIINNGYLGMVRQWQELFYDRRYSATPITSPDFVKIAEAHGLTGLRATNRKEAVEAIDTARATPGTVVIDFRIEPEDCVYPMVPAGAALHKMIRRPMAQ